jgi:hypothetical protein
VRNPSLSDFKTGSERRDKGRGSQRVREKSTLSANDHFFIFPLGEEETRGGVEDEDGEGIGV